MLHRAIRGQSVEVFKWVLDQVNGATCVMRCAAHHVLLYIHLWRCQFARSIIADLVSITHSHVLLLMIIYVSQSPALASCPATDRNKNTPLHDAVSEGLRGLPFVNELLRYLCLVIGFVLHHTRGKLSAWSRNKQTHSLRFSFQACIDVNLPSGTGRTALHYAARDDVPELVRALRSIDRSESSCHARDKSGKTPLHWVAGNTSMKHVKEVGWKNAIVAFFRHPLLS